MAAGGFGIQAGVAIRLQVVQYPVARSAVSTLISPVPPELRGIRRRGRLRPSRSRGCRPDPCAPSQPRSSSVPKVPSSCQAPAGHVQATVAVARDVQEAHRRRFGSSLRTVSELPPQSLDESAATLGLDRPAELLVDRANLRRAGGRVVADGGQLEQVARQLRAVRVEDERAPHAERAAEQPGLEHHAVARRRSADWDASALVQVVLANTNAAKSTSWESSTYRGWSAPG